MARLPPELRARFYGLVALVIALLALSAAWQWSPLHEWLAPDRLISALRELGEALGPAAAIAVLTLALVVAMPLGLLTLASQFALGPWVGSACLLLSAMLAAAFSQWLGRSLGHALLLRMAGPRMMRLSLNLAARGLPAVIAIRLVPMAPFAIVNMVAGSTHLRRRDMLAGTFIGMLPGTLLMALFTDQLMLALQQPGPGRWALIGGVVALFLFGGWALKRWLVPPV